jgi:hypothetical protein
MKRKEGSKHQELMLIELTFGQQLSVQHVFAPKTREQK